MYRSIPADSCSAVSATFVVFQILKHAGIYTDAKIVRFVMPEWHDAGSHGPAVQVAGYVYACIGKFFAFEIVGTAAVEFPVVGQ